MAQGGARPPSRDLLPYRNATRGDEDFWMQCKEAGRLVEELPIGACLEKLESASVGRLGVSVDALPVVLPVNFAVDGDSIIIRTSPGTKLSSAINEAVVAFEIDEYDAETNRGWSVMVQGTAREITTKARLERARALPLPPLTPDGTDDRFMEVYMEIVTGRRIEPARGAEASPGA